MKILQNFVAFLEYMNFKQLYLKLELVFQTILEFQLMNQKIFDMTNAKVRVKKYPCYLSCSNEFWLFENILES